MRNLKRVLSLALALMMALSVMAFSGSASAAESDTIPVASELYSDYDQTNYSEAVDVITALKIVEGSDGQLLPDETLRRSEATTLAARMLLGVDAAATLSNVSTYTGYTDVDSVNHWAAPYIAFCDNQGIVSGVGGRNFDPNGQLTGVAFGKVILTVLGYDADKEGLKGDNWATNVLIALANAGISVLDSDGNPIDLSQPITREQAMEMTYQALQTPLVEYPTNINNGAAIATRNGATYVTSTLAREQRINNQALTGGTGFTVEFAEKYFPSLWLTGATTTSGTLTDRTDAFGRPAHTWTYKNVDIHTYDNEELLVDKWTTGVTGETLGKAINYSAISRYGLEVYVDGAAANPAPFRTALTNGSRSDLPYTGNGVQVEVYVDHEPIYSVAGVTGGTGNISIVIINTYLAAVTGSSKVDVYYGANNKTDGTNRNVAQSKDAAVSDYAKNDKVKVLVADPTHTAYEADEAIKNERYKVQEVSDVETVSDVNITSYSLGTISDVADDQHSSLKTITAGGETYTSAYKMFYDANVLYNYNQNRDELRTATFAIYKDDYGFALGVEELEGADNYIFVVGWAHGEDALGYAGDRALIITTDGTMKSVNANAENLKKWEPTSATAGSWIDDTRLTTKTEHSDGTNTATGTGTNAAVNTWYTYSMDGDTYVLEREVRNQGQTAATTISNKYASLVKNTPTNLGKVNTANSYAYGNDASVYIVVGASTNVNENGSITKVDRVLTGIRNTSVSVTTTASLGTNFTGNTFFASGHSASNTGVNTFFIYDENNYVKYAVTIGEVESNSEDKIYFTGGVTRRGVEVGGKVYDTYEVIRNGEKTTVDVLESEANAQNGGQGPVNGQLYIAGFDTNGKVTKLTLEDTERISTGGEPTVNATNPYYVLQKGTATKALTIREDGNTVWVKKGNDTEGYIRLASDCEIFLFGDRGYTAKTLAEALDETNGELGEGQVVAICNTNGDATTLIIVKGKLETPTSTPTTPTTPVEVAPYGLKLDGTDFYVTYATKDIWDTQDAIKSFLEDKGFTDVDVTIDHGEITVVSAKRGNNSVTFTLHPDVIAPPASDSDLSSALSAVKGGFVTFVEQTVDSEKQTVSLKGNVTPIDTNAGSIEDALKVFANEDNKTPSAFESLYDLEADSYGYVVVNVGGDEMLLLVGVRKASSNHPWADFNRAGCTVAPADQLGIVLRDSATGKVVFLSQYYWAAKGVTINVKDLVLSGS